MGTESWSMENYAHLAMIRVWQLNVKEVGTELSLKLSFIKIQICAVFQVGQELLTKGFYGKLILTRLFSLWKYPSSLMCLPLTRVRLMFWKCQELGMHLVKDSEKWWALFSHSGIRLQEQNTVFVICNCLSTCMQNSLKSSNGTLNVVNNNSHSC